MQRLALRLLVLLFLAVSSPVVQAVVGGAGVDANVPDSPWAGVGAVLAGKGHYTGALIGRRHVLTAAHVVKGRLLTELAFRINRSEAEPLVLPVAAVHIHPGYHGTRRAADGFWRDDLAVLELARPAPDGVPVYDLYPSPDLVRAMIVFVGHGRGGDGVQGAHLPGSPRVKRVGYNRIDALLPHGPTDPRPVLFLFDFDGPDSGSNRFGPATVTYASLGPGLEAAFAGGDSGAPVFVHDRGSWKIAGVASFLAGREEAASSRYGSIGGGTLVPAYLDWIRALLQASVPADSPAVILESDTRR
ncbi:MAG: S1 family peptidase [Thiobacillaceae bacterium]